MTESEEQAYNDGIRQAAVTMMGEILRMIGRQPATEALVLERERAKVVNILREVCEEHGDNDWKDNLNLSDVIEKHLWKHLEADRPEMIESLIRKYEEWLSDRVEDAEKFGSAIAIVSYGSALTKFRELLYAHCRDGLDYLKEDEEQQTACSVCGDQSIRKDLAICHCGRYAHCRCIDQCRHIDQ